MGSDTTQTEHTATPWKAGSIVYQSGCERTIYIGTDEGEYAVGAFSCITPNDYPNDFKGDKEREALHVANAAFIVRAVNSHAALISALERATARFRAAVRGLPVRDMAETLAEVEYALKLAKSDDTITRVDRRG